MLKRLTTGGARLGTEVLPEGGDQAAAREDAPFAGRFGLKNGFRILPVENEFCLNKTSFACTKMALSAAVLPVEGDQAAAREDAPLSNA